MEIHAERSEDARDRRRTPDLQMPIRSPRGRERLAPHEASWISTHPLARRTATTRAFVRQLALSLALFALALVAGVLVGTGPASLIIGGALATCLFGLIVAVAAGAERQEVIDTVARGELRVAAALAPARLSALTSQRSRQTLARTLARCLQPASRARGDILSRPRAHLRHDPGLRTEFEDVIRRLRRRDAAATGVALVYRLVTEPGSPLYTGTAHELRSSLGRISYRLAEREAIPNGNGRSSVLDQ
jgi:hypothetical protein